MIEEKIKKNINKIIKKLNYPVKEIILETPKNPNYGDLYTPLALQISKEIKEDSYNLAKKIVKNFPNLEEIKKVEIIKPGFINFFLDESVYLKNLFSWLEKDFKNILNEGKKIIIEFGQPNTHKIPHIGHLYSYIYGESLARIFEVCGNKVVRVNYQGDIGLHVAKCLWRFKKYLIANEKKISSFQSLEEKVKFLQICYQEGTQEYEKSEQVKKEIDELNIKIYQKDPSIVQLWKETRQWSLDFYKIFELKLGINFKRYYFESETAEIGKRIVFENLKKVFHKSGQTIIFKGEDYGLHTRVFINKYGNPTYEAKDIGLAFLKNKEFDFDLSIITTANEQNEYWKVVIKAIDLIFPHLKNKIIHLGFGMINLNTGKISSRLGKIIDPFILINKVKNEIKENFQVKNDQLLEKIALCSIKYSFLMSDYKKDIIFDLEKSIAKEGNSGPYLLYTYVRCQSVLKKIKKDFLDFKNDKFLKKIRELSFSKEEINLLKKVYFFDKVIIKAKNNYSPNIIANYLYELASLFNIFYQKYPIIKGGEYLFFRIALTKSVSQILKKGLFLLGIETVEKI